jgi:hypothetical protein
LLDTALAFAIAVFAASWWGLQVKVKIDEESALAVATIAFTIVTTIGGAVATEKHGATDSSEATIRSGGIDWPDPQSIRGIKNYVEILRRTWIVAGAPSHLKTEHATCGLVKSSQVDSLLGDYQLPTKYFLPQYRTLSTDDLDSLPIVLQAWSVPQPLIALWKEAGPRASKGEVKQRMHAKRTERVAHLRQYEPYWVPKMITAAILCPALAFMVGMSYPALTEIRLGPANWIALILSSIVLFSVFVWEIFFLILDEFYLGYASETVRLTVVACCLATSFLGWRLTHGAHSIGELKHISLIARDWLVFRF